jgi:hypothetical protein
MTKILALNLCVFSNYTKFTQASLLRNDAFCLTNIIYYFHHIYFFFFPFHVITNTHRNLPETHATFTSKLNYLVSKTSLPCTVHHSTHLHTILDHINSSPSVTCHYITPITLVPVHTSNRTLTHKTCRRRTHPPSQKLHDKSPAATNKTPSHRKGREPSR